MAKSLGLLLLLVSLLEAKVSGPGSLLRAGRSEDAFVPLRSTLDEEAEDKQPAEGEEASEDKVAAEGEKSAIEGEAEATSGEAEGSEEAEAEGAEGEEGEEEELIPSEADSEVAYMLLGAVIFVVSLFYLVNWDDDDIRYYSMNIISMTMSIFSAVLMYQGINDQIKRFSADLPEFARVVIQFAHCACYIVIMQVLISALSGVVVFPGATVVNFDEKVWLIAEGLRCDYGRKLTPEEVQKVRAVGREPDAKRSVWLDQHNIEVPVRKERHNLRRAQRWMRCWAMLLAHMSGFAAINAGARLQAVEVFASSPGMALLPAIINQVVLQIFFKLSSMARSKSMEDCIKNQESSGHFKVKLCHEAVVEAENDVSSLSLSFLSVQVIRFIISGIMPNEEGEEEPLVAHSWIHIATFFGIGLMAMILAIVMAMKCTSEEEEEDEETHDKTPKKAHKVPDEPLSERLGMIISNSLAMAFAWILLFGTKWTLIKVEFLNIESMMGQIVHALGLSIFCGLAVFLLDSVDDTVRETKGGAEAASKAIRVIIQAIAILVGFSWEHCFDAAVADVAFITPHKRLSKFLLGCFVCVFLVPAWRRHILTKVMAYEELKKQKRHFNQQKKKRNSREYQPVSSAERK